MWQEGFHCSKNFRDTNKELSEITGDISTKDAQIAFAKFCSANPRFAAKLLMGIDIYPFQDVMIRAMNAKDYFLGVCSRGLGKSVSINDLQQLVTKKHGLISTKSLFPDLEFKEHEEILEIEPLELWNGDSFQKTEKILLQKGKNCSKVNTRMSYCLEGSTNHKIKVLDKKKQEIVWKKYHELKKEVDYICISRNETPYIKDFKEDLYEAYLVSLLVGDVSTSAKAKVKIGGKTYYFKLIPKEILKNKNLLKHFLSGLFDCDGGFEAGGKTVTYCTVSKVLATQVHLSLLNFGIISRLREKNTKSNFGKAYVIQIHGEEARKFYERIGFCLTHKQVGAKIFDIIRTNTNTDIIPGSIELIQQIKKESGYTLCRYTEQQYSVHPSNSKALSRDKVGRYLDFIKNVKNISSPSLDKLEALYDSNFFFDTIESIEHSTADCIDFTDIPDGACYWSNGFISHNSTIAGVFLPLYAIFNPGVTIGITSSGFRQARNIFEKIETTIRSPQGKFLKQCLRGDPKHNSDAWEMNIGESKIVALPLGCLSGDSYIKTDFGFEKIKNIYDHSGDASSMWHRVGFKVDSYEKPETRCANVVYMGKKNLYKIKLKNGIELSCSPDHRFLAKKNAGDSGDWVMAKDLSAKSFVCLDMRKNFPSQTNGRSNFQKGFEDGVKQSFSEKINLNFLNWGEEYLRGFIHGIIETTGSVDGVKRKVVFHVLNEELAKLIQIHLLSFGVNSNRAGNVIDFSRLNLFSYEKNVVKENYTKKFLRPYYFNFVRKMPDFIYEPVSECFLSEDEEDVYDLRVPAYCNYNANGVITHNSGDKIRGYRFNLLVIDELLLLSEKIINEVLLPFMAVQIDPRKRQETREAEDILIKMGKMEESDRTIFSNNKLIGLTSASYQFEYLYKMFMGYKEMIFDENAQDVSHGLMQLSYQMAPVGLYDNSNITNAKKTFSRAQFDREYMAAFTGDSSGFYSAKKLFDTSLKLGDTPTIKIKGDPSRDYILAIDPNYDSSETSDHFGMSLGEVEYENGKIYMVHGYAVASCTLNERMDYIKYLFDNFNIVYLIVDKAGGEKFVKDINDLGILDFKLAFFDADFIDFTDEEIHNANSTYSAIGGVRKIVHSQYFSAGWIRYANETLQGSIENKKMVFAAPVDAEHLDKTGIPIAKILFNEKETYGEDKVSLDLKLNDFVDHQSFIIEQTKAQCALIEVTSSGSVAKFDLPATLRNQTGPDKARKDSYSALLLLNWARYCWVMMKKEPIKKKKSFTPIFIGS